MKETLFTDTVGTLTFNKIRALCTWQHLPSSFSSYFYVFVDWISANVLDKLYVGNWDKILDLGMRTAERLFFYAMLRLKRLKFDEISCCSLKMELV